MHRRLFHRNYRLLQLAYALPRPPLDLLRYRPIAPFQYLLVIGQQAVEFGTRRFSVIGCVGCVLFGFFGRDFEFVSCSPLKKREN
jgi:hypothetical protein